MKIFILVTFIILLFSHCNLDVTKNKIDKKKNRNGHALDVEFQTSYGFIVSNNLEQLFYSVDRKIMQKYLNENISSKQILNDIQSTKWVAEMKGCRFEIYSFWSWFHNFYNKEFPLNYCDTIINSKIVPVYITDLTYSSDLHFSKLKKCESPNNRIPFDVYIRPSLFITYIEPLNTQNSIDFLNLKDTINRERYLNYIKFNCH